MNVKEAIKIAQKGDILRKESQKKQREHLAKITTFQVNEENIIKKRKQELLQQIIEKSNRINEEVREGIRFLESRKRYFRLHSETKIALYLYSNGSLHVQLWGFMMGDKYIEKLKKDMYDYFDFETLQALVDIDFKSLVIQQIVGCKK